MRPGVDAGQVRPLDDPSTPAGVLGVIRHDLRAAVDAHPTAADHHAHPLADQTPRHRIGVRVHRHRAVRLHPADQIPQLPERRPSGARAQTLRLAPEALQRRLAGGAVAALVRDLALPPRQVPPQRLQALELAARDRVALDVAHAPFVLPLRARPVRRARPRTEAPVRRERQEPVVELHLARRRVVLLHQRLRVVHQHLLGNAAEVPERPLQPREPRRLALVPERLRVAPPRVAQRRHEQLRPHPLAPDRHPRLAEVDLQLPTRRRLEPQRRLRLRPQLPPMRRHRPLHRAQARLHAQLARQLLAHHLRVAPMPEEALPQPRVQPVQLAAAPRPAVRRPAVRLQVPPHRVPTAAELPRNPPRSPTQLVQPQHRLHLLRPQHSPLPRSLQPHASVALPHPVNPLFLVVCQGQFSCRMGVSFACRLTLASRPAAPGWSCSRMCGQHRMASTKTAYIVERS